MWKQEYLDIKNVQSLFLSKYTALLIYFNAYA